MVPDFVNRFTAGKESAVTKEDSTQQEEKEE